MINEDVLEDGVCAYRSFERQGLTQEQILAWFEKEAPWFIHKPGYMDKLMEGVQYLRDRDKPKTKAQKARVKQERIEELLLRDMRENELVQKAINQNKSREV